MRRVQSSRRRFRLTRWVYACVYISISVSISIYVFYRHLYFNKGYDSPPLSHRRGNATGPVFTTPLLDRDRGQLYVADLRGALSCYELSPLHGDAPGRPGEEEVSLSIYIYIYTHTHTHTYIYIYICLCLCVCLYIYAHIYIYIYIHDGKINPEIASRQHERRRHVFPRPPPSSASQSERGPQAR